MNVCEALIRLFRPADEFTDIPLTPEQRALLGLNPNTPLSVSASSDNIITPPRYTKSSSRTGSPVFYTPAQHTGASPSMASSPLRRSGGPERRLSGSFGSSTSGFGSPAPGNRRLYEKSITPSKIGGASVVPGNKWLYEKSIQRKSMPFLLAMVCIAKC
jgi:nucleoporin POM34